MDQYPHNPNPNHTIDISDFELSDYLMFENGSNEDFSSQNMVSSENLTGGFTEFTVDQAAANTSDIKFENEVKKNKADAGLRFAFITKSELEIMDDGFKWRKYGKKMVKNSPNPRNYYKCSSGGCNVKKRVQRDGEDPRYVITTYDGTHNHESPCVVCYDQVPLMLPHAAHAWTCQQASSSHSSSS